MKWLDGARRWAVAGFAALCGVAMPAQATDKALIPAETFFNHPALLDVKLSPSGRYLGLTAVHDNRRVALLAVDLQTHEPAKVVAYFASQDVAGFAWVNDERMLFTLGQLEPDKRNSYGSGVLSVDVSSRKYTQLICAPGLICPKAQSSQFSVLSVPRLQPGVRPDEVVAGRYDGPQDGVIPVWMNARTAAVRRMEMPRPPERAAAWWFDSQGRPRLVLSIDKEQKLGTYHWLAADAKEWRSLASFKLLEPPFDPVAVSDDGQLYVKEPRGPAREAVLTSFDFEAGKPSARSIVQAPGFDFEGSLLERESGQGLLGVSLQADSQVSVWFDPAMKALQEEVDRRFPGQVNAIVCRRCGLPDMLAVVHSYSDRDPGRYVLYRAEGKLWETVSIVMPDVKPQQMAAVDFQRIQARDGRDLPVWLTLPTGVEPGKPAPAVVLVHGGPWMRKGYWQWAAMSQFLASRGYLVVEPEFRGSLGYGDAHFKAGFRQWGLAMQDDLADALLWARQAGLASDKACVMGPSYGGYAAVMGLIRHPELFRCGVSWIGITDLLLFLEGSVWVIDDIGRNTRRHALPELVGDADKDADKLRAVSPVAQAARIRAPLLLAYGDKDYRVPINHGRRLRDAMTEAGNPPEYVEYENEGHGWQHMATRLDFARRVENFLAQHLRP